MAGAGDCILGQHLISFATGCLYLFFCIHLSSAERQFLGFFLLLLASAKCIWYTFGGISTSVCNRGWYLSRQIGLINIQEGHITRAITTFISHISSQESYLKCFLFFLLSGTSSHNEGPKTGSSHNSRFISIGFWSHSRTCFFLLKSWLSSEDLQINPPAKPYSFMPLSGSPLLSAGEASHLEDPLFYLWMRNHCFLVKPNTLRWERAQSHWWYLWLIHYLLTWMHSSLVERVLGNLNPLCLPAITTSLCSILIDYLKMEIIKKTVIIKYSQHP